MQNDCRCPPSHEHFGRTYCAQVLIDKHGRGIGFCDCGEEERRREIFEELDEKLKTDND